MNDAAGVVAERAPDASATGSRRELLTRAICLRREESPAARQFPSARLLFSITGLGLGAESCGKIAPICLGKYVQEHGEAWLSSLRV